MRPKTLDHVALWVADRDAITDFLVERLSMHVIERTDKFTLAGGVYTRNCGACEPECPVEAIFPEDALPEKWEPFVKINYAYGDGAEVVNKLTDEYATEHNVQNPPLE